MKPLIVILLFLLFAPIQAQKAEGISGWGEWSEQLLAVQRQNQWGFVNTQGELVIPFRDDVYTEDGKPEFREGRCRIFARKDGILYIGYMDTAGKVVIPPQYLNATPFQQGKAVVIKVTETQRGTNEYLNKKIVSHEFDEVLIDSMGTAIEYLKQIKGVLLSKDRYQQPPIQSVILADHLLGVRGNDGSYRLVTY